MASEGHDSSRLVSNPFIKKRNLEWHLSPPPPRRPKEEPQDPAQPRDETMPDRSGAGSALSSAAIEAGETKIADHLAHFGRLLTAQTLNPFPPGAPRLPVPAYQALYRGAAGSPRGAHFVVHQHDHPVAGTHYDLRLQINGTSSVSWAVLYGLPGAPNGRRLNRNAAETRVHTLWNHLVETGSRATGSLLVWDTGTYRVLRRRSKHAPAADPESAGEEEDDDDDDEQEENQQGRTTEQEKLHAAFASRKIRLRLDGARLPRPYVLNLRITKKEDALGRSRALRDASRAGGPPRKRRRKGQEEKQRPLETSSSGSSSGGADSDATDSEMEPEPMAAADATMAPGGSENGEKLSEMEKELREIEDDEVRRTNAYPGASNTIGSVYQRRWYLSLDRINSGFVRRRRKGEVAWEHDQSPPVREEQEPGRLSYPFYVRGPEHERSIVSGRLGREVLRDEGITDYVGRKGWQPVLS